jgi:hypothetical protein
MARPPQTNNGLLGTMPGVGTHSGGSGRRQESSGRTCVRNGEKRSSRLEFVCSRSAGLVPPVINLNHFRGSRSFPTHYVSLVSSSRSVPIDPAPVRSVRHARPSPVRGTPHTADPVQHRPVRPDTDRPLRPSRPPHSPPAPKSPPANAAPKRPLIRPARTVRSAPLRRFDSCAGTRTAPRQGLA